MRPPPFPLPKAPAQADKAWLLGLLGGAVGHGLGETLRFATTGRLANLANAVALGMLVVCVLLAGLAWQRRPPTLRLLEAVFASAALLGLCQPLLQRAGPGALVALWAALGAVLGAGLGWSGPWRTRLLSTLGGALGGVFGSALLLAHAKTWVVALVGKSLWGGLVVLGVHGACQTQPETQTPSETTPQSNEA